MFASMPVESASQYPTVLIAEDHDDSRLMLKVYLEQLGCVVLEAWDGRQAVDVGETEQPDLIFMDADLPGLDGVTAVHRLRQNGVLNNTPIVMTSGWTAPGVRDQALAAGCVAYITKPIELDHLNGLLFHLLKNDERAPDDRNGSSRDPVGSVRTH
jgi:CheY-like chemotaxis protein